MSLHVYIAKAGWTSTPISEADWKDAISRIPELEIQPVRNRKRSYPLLAVLKNNKNQMLNLTQGLVHAQNPDAQLVAAMFELARILDAKVYSEKAKPYKTVEDWQKKTKSYYAERERRIDKSKHEIRMRTIRFLLGVAVVILVALLIKYAANADTLDEATARYDFPFASNDY